MYGKHRIEKLFFVGGYKVKYRYGRDLYARVYTHAISLDDIIPKKFNLNTS